MLEKKVFISGFAYDKNTHNNHSFGAYTTLKKFGTITLAECKEIYEKIQNKILKENEYVKSIEIDLTLYNKYQENGIPVYATEENPISYNSDKKIARYYPNENLLRIWVNDRIVYENYNGKICKDEAALADSIM